MVRFVSTPIRRGAAGRRWRDDTGSLPLAMLVLVSGIGLSVGLASSVVTQLTATRIDIGRADALNAAQAGLDVVAAHVRAATDEDGEGRLALLPCNELNGSVGGQPAAEDAPAPQARYRVEIAYYQFDPRDTTDNPVLPCFKNSGTAKVPGFAVLTSTGTDGRPNGMRRIIKATYTLRTTNENIAGGLVRVWKMNPTDTDLCLDASADNVLRVQSCDSRRPQQKFAYHRNLNLVHVPSKTDASPLGNCLDAGASPVDRTPVRLVPCASTTQVRQQWSLTNNRNFVGTTSAGDFNDLCFNLENGAVQPGTRIILRSLAAGGCYVGPDNRTQMFYTDATVGAGAAGSSTNQLVNYEQFGRCIDVTLYDVLYGYLISYPCKQAPRSDKVSWNQRFTLPAPTTVGEVTSGTGIIYTNINAWEANGRTGHHCLTRSTTPTSNPIVTVTPCPATGSPPATQRWRVVGKAADYPSGYRIEAVSTSPAMCLAAARGPAHMAPDGMSKIIVEPCSGDLLQKWNAPAYIGDPSPLTDVREN